ncbi:hypothetical protein AGMMS50267_02240 [Spirochaetia bacterium]|nr:hypothetical protein AGMMS50267_02240 [Spirochaetia bacterium]
MANENTALTIKIDYEDSISLADFQKSLEGWNSQYITHISRTNVENMGDVLLIKEIKQECIFIELASSIIPLFSDYNTVIDFFVSMKSLFSWLTSKIGPKPSMEIEDLENAKKIIAPVNNHNGRQINISIEGNNYAPIVIDSGNARTIALNADEEIKKLSAPEKENESDENKEKVILKFIQIKNDESDNKNTKGVISEIDKVGHPVMFSSGIKSNILQETDNPFLKNYLVDVKVNKIDNVIKSYTILELHDSYIDEDNQNEGGLFD